MIWYLLFMMLFGGGSSPIIVPNLDNYVKEYVVDETRKDSIVNLIEISNDKTEEIGDKNKDLVKELKSFYKSREATSSDFESTMNEILANQVESQKVNLMVVEKSHSQITSEEWTEIQQAIYTSLEKSDEERAEETNKQKKKFDKLTEKVSKNIADKDKRKLAIEALEEVKTVYLRNREILRNELLDKKSVIYQYKASDKDLVELQEKVYNLYKEFFEETFKAHFKLVELTTEEEWEDIY